MDISSKKVYEALAEKGVENIHHANSVITACQFLRQGSLMSRGTVERKDFFQTKQKSDTEDLNYGIWFDVFVDSVDIHERAKKPNAYGPVMLVMDVKLIEEAYTGRVWVTKLNPTKWEGKSRNERWFSSAEDLKTDFVKGRFDQMIVFRHCGGELPFKEYLKEIILDDPKLETNKDEVDFYSMAYGALRLSMTEGGIDVPIHKRTCSEKCTCVTEYQADTKRSKEMYSPKI